MTEEIQALLDQKDTRIAELEDEVATLKALVAELIEHKNMNSGNSSKPPSMDGLKKPVNKNRSLREKSGKKPGGQKGHTGKHLTVLSEPDHTEKHCHVDCLNCPHYQKCMKASEVKETRYVIDAVVTVDVTAHELIAVPCCPLCKSEKAGVFPDDVKACVQYGENLEAFAVTLNTVGAVSVDRTHKILSGAFNIPISVGTINNMVDRCSDKITPAYNTIGEEIKTSKVVNADETSASLNGKTKWVHDISNGEYTYLALREQRGYDAIKDIGILTDYNGILVHDCLSSYWRLDGVTHQLCCAHLLRELNGVSENHPEQKWALQFKELLLKMKHSKDKAIDQGKSGLCKATLKKYSDCYDKVIKLAYEENPIPEKMPGKRGKPKRGKVLSLIDRLFKHKGEVCLFINNFCAPFDNNQAERDVRNVKVKTKVSGFFKTFKGANNYLKIMSFVGTANKRGISAYDAIRYAVIGCPKLIFE